MTEEIRDQGSPHWFKSRIGLVTGSNVGAILGCDPFREPDDVMRQMVRSYHGAESEFTGNVATEYGTFHEAGARIDYQLWSGRIVDSCGFFILDSSPQWLGTAGARAKHTCAPSRRCRCLRIPSASRTAG